MKVTILNVILGFGSTRRAIPVGGIQEAALVICREGCDFMSSTSSYEDGSFYVADTNASEVTTATLSGFTPEQRREIYRLVFGE